MMLDLLDHDELDLECNDFALGLSRQTSNFKIEWIFTDPPKTPKIFDFSENSV